MSLMINDDAIASDILAARRASGADRHDEVWEDVYMMVPAPNNEHQELASELTAVLRTVIDWKELGLTLAAANVSDRRDKWSRNYRVPDVVVFLSDTEAEDCGTHWLGGPDLAIEIVSPGDRTLDKLDFYALVRTRQLLVIDRDPWQVTLYRPASGGKLSPVAMSNDSQQTTIALDGIPVRIGWDSQTPSLRLTDPGGQLIREIPIATRA